jgi:hypothetical protein
VSSHLAESGIELPALEVDSLTSETISRRALEIG